MTARPLVGGVLAACALSACGPRLGSVPAPYRYWKIGGQYFAPVGPDLDAQRLGVASQLAEDYGCATTPESLAAIEVGEARGGVVRARGCGHEGLYLEVVHSELAATGYRVVFRYASLVDLARVGDVVATSVPGALSPDAEVARAQLARWRALVDAGARALACPSVATWPEWVVRTSGRRARGPAPLGVVEGCGRRAIFEATAGTWGDALPAPSLVALETRAPAESPPGTSDLARQRADAARDLACPLAEIVARTERHDDLHPVAVAEGCGRRVTYLPDGPLPGEGIRSRPYRYRVWRIDPPGPGAQPPP
jgi:hypothetical protein